MRAYISIVKLRFILLVQYRSAAVAGMCTQMFWGIVKVMVFDAFFSLSASVQPMSFAKTASYIWLGQAMLALQPWGGDGEVQALIRNGNIAYELCRPVDLYSQWYCRFIALRTAPTLLRSIPIFIISFFLLPGAYRLQPPASAASGAAWAAATVGALLISCAFSMLINITTLWSVAGEGISRLLPAVAIVFSGMVAPIPLFPDWMQPVLRILPFSGLVDTPFRLYLGLIPAGDVFYYLSQQLIWTAILAVLGRLLLSAAMKRVVVQGG